ncbi:MULTISPECIES: 2-hydroxy-3-oxopropionate reductase [unclassified Variovorax]|uniref:2-hydroxy-3-oxopropionate reductase n=1 Tax=unclassified Variovorax TaxID=663243 RepID=UPI0008399809|nr:MULTISPECIES: 2-hydroxy-3-oxopropionate reductase [unclassified Variovorax]
MPSIGFIGLGVMGRPMVRNLLKGGLSLSVFTHGDVPADIAASAFVCAHAREVAQRADTIIVMVPDTPDVEAVLFGEQGAAAGLSAGKTVIDMSSISPIVTKTIARRIGKLGCHYLDAPVSGGEVGAQQGTLSIMVGGPAEVFEAAHPLFALMGKNISHVGDHGDGQTAKVANQIIVALNIQAVAEALVFAARAGADPERVRRALMGGFATSKVLEVHGERMTGRHFEPGFRISLHQKDLNLALESARLLGMALPNTATAQQMFGSCVAQGGARWDHSALVRAIELMAGCQVGLDRA